MLHGEQVKKNLIFVNGKKNYFFDIKNSFDLHVYWNDCCIINPQSECHYMYSIFICINLQIESIFSILLQKKLTYLKQFN